MQRRDAPSASRRGGPPGGRSAPKVPEPGRTMSPVPARKVPGGKAGGKTPAKGRGKGTAKEPGKKAKRPAKPRDPEKERARREKEAERKRRRAHREQKRARNRRARKERHQVRAARRRARRLALLLWVQAMLYRLHRLVWPEYTRRLPKAKAVLVLVLNVAPFPGLGTVVYGKWERGLAQFLLTFIFLLGWVWAIMDGVRIVHKAFASPKRGAKRARRTQAAQSR